MEVPEAVYESEDAFEAFMDAVGEIADPRESGLVLARFFQGWLDRYGADPEEPEAQKRNARTMIATIEAGLDRLYQCDVRIARLEDERDVARESYFALVAELRTLYRRMAFWRGRNDPDVEETAQFVRERFSPEEANHILDLDGVFETDVPLE